MNYRQQAKRGRRSDSKERMDQDLNLLLNMMGAGGAGAEPSLPKSWSRGRSTSRSKSERNAATANSRVECPNWLDPISKQSILLRFRRQDRI